MTEMINEIFTKFPTLELSGIKLIYFQYNELLCSSKILILIIEDNIICIYNNIVSCKLCKELNVALINEPTH